MSETKIFFIVVILLFSYSLKIETQKIAINVVFNQSEYSSQSDNLIYDIMISNLECLDHDNLKLKLILPEELLYKEMTSNSSVIFQEKIENTENTEILLFKLSDIKSKDKLKIRLRMKYSIFPDQDSITGFQTSDQFQMTLISPARLYFHDSTNFWIRIENKSMTETLCDIKISAFISENLEYISADTHGCIIVKECKPIIILQSGKLLPISYIPERGKKLSIVSWNLGNIPPKSSKQIKATFKAKKCGTAIWAVMLNSKNFIQYSLAYTRILCHGAMHINSRDTEDPININQINTYVVECRNESSAPCNNIILEYKLDRRLKFIKAEGPTNYRIFNEAIIFEPYPRLAKLGTLKYKIFCKAIKSGFAKNKALLYCDEAAEDIIDTESTFILPNIDNLVEKK